MAERDTKLSADIIIYGGGIAGLWTLNYLKKLRYDVLLVEPRAIGGIQTIASQGIIHSGLKYVLGGKINPLARSISAMPKVWKNALQGHGMVDLSKARVAAASQSLLIPGGMMGNIIKLGAKSFFGKEIPEFEWPKDISASGFDGSIINMGEPVLDVPSVVRALAEPYKNLIRQSAESVSAKKYIYTAAAGNDGVEIETQRRPLLMCLIRNAPFPLWAHLVGNSEKPVATITTHTSKDGKLIWYIGGQIAECTKEEDPQVVYESVREALAKYMPAINTDGFEWATLPIDRVEAKGSGFMPDAPVVHKEGNKIFAWPTKLTFAPLMAEKIAAELARDGITPSRKKSDWSFLPEVAYAEPPWETVKWNREK